MQRSTVEKIEKWGRIFALMRDRRTTGEPLSELEVALLESNKHCPHYRRARSMFRFLKKRSPAEVGINALARHLKTSERNAYDFVQALRRGGLEF